MKLIAFASAVSLIVVSITGCNNVQPSENTAGSVYHLPDSATPVDYAKLACDTYMSTYEPAKLPPENAFFIIRVYCFRDLSGYTN